MAKPLLVGTFRVVCQGCQKPLGTRLCIAKLNGLISHGICPDCEAELRRKFGLSPRPVSADGVTTPKEEPRKETDEIERMLRAGNWQGAAEALVADE
jgi:hypothetical protein